MKKLFLSIVLVGCGPDGNTVVVGIQSENPVVREDMVEFAKKFDEPKVVEALVGTLNDPSEVIRLKAVKSLGELKPKVAAEPLVTVFEQDESEYVRREAIEALGRIGDPIAVEPFLTYLQTFDPNKAPVDVIWALGNIGDRSALTVLSELRETSQDPYVVFNVNMALRKIR